MIHKLLCVFALLFAAVAVAQDPPNLESPPRLDTPHHWQIHNPNGPMDLELVAYYVDSDLHADIYYFEITGTVNGQPYRSDGWAYDPIYGDGTTIDVWNGDSELWTEWVWRGDHYEKVGGTPNRRTYHPVFD